MRNPKLAHVLVKFVPWRVSEQSHSLAHILFTLLKGHAALLVPKTHVEEGAESLIRHDNISYNKSWLWQV